jgi:iron(III) transport system permease protein
MAAFVLLILGGTFTPLVGLTLPVVSGNSLSRAWHELSRTSLNTLLYATGAGVVAVALGFSVAVCVGRNHRLRTVVIGVALTLFSLPPALAALGVVQLATALPALVDPLFRSRFTVSVALGVRFFPVAAVLGLRAWGSLSSTWTFAAGLHGVSLWTYLRRVVVPLLVPAGTVAVLLVTLLAIADISTVLLLHPPGEQSLPLTIFTVMANAPEALVASLCLVYTGAAVGALLAGWALVGRLRI